MAKRHMYIRLDYESIWVNNHGAAVEMDPDMLENMVKLQLTDCYPLNEMNASAQVTGHNTSKPAKPILTPRNCG